MHVKDFCQGLANNYEHFEQDSDLARWFRAWALDSGMTKKHATQQQRVSNGTFILIMHLLFLITALLKICFQHLRDICLGRKLEIEIVASNSDHVVPVTYCQLIKHPQTLMIQE